jgi:hypothetical protein
VSTHISLYKSLLILIILFINIFFFLSNKKNNLKSVLMNLSKNWHIITNKSSQQRVHLLLQELNIGSPINSLIYIKFGYKILSPQDKETYYLLRDISQINYRKTNEPICSINLDYLSISLGTTESSQHRRIKKLEKCKLLETLPNGDYFIYSEPYPDSTFVSTTVKLIRRKRLGELIRLYNSCNNPVLRINYLSEINKLKAQGVTHSKLETITDIKHSYENSGKKEKEEDVLNLIQTLAKMPNYRVI